jgi:hypothetical protein
LKSLLQATCQSCQTLSCCGNNQHVGILGNYLQEKNNLPFLFQP